MDRHGKHVAGLNFMPELLLAPPGAVPPDAADGAANTDPADAPGADLAAMATRWQQTIQRALVVPWCW